MTDVVARLVQEFASSKEKWLSTGTPWITEGAKAWLARNTLPTDRVLEFGAGRSTVFWATRAAKVTVVEGSPDWTIWGLMHLYKNPALMKKVRWHLCPAEWNPDFPRGVRRYWTENRQSLDSNDVADLERDLTSVSFPGHNVVLFDGNIRKQVFLYQVATMNFDEIEVVVIDNCEGAFISESATKLMPSSFERLDFVAGKLDEVPSHQNGKHITSIFVKPARLKASAPVQTEVPPMMTYEQRQNHMLPAVGYDLDKDIRDGYKYLNEVLKLNVSAPRV